jgi:hypothetical protein
LGKRKASGRNVAVRFSTPMHATYEEYLHKEQNMAHVITGVLRRCGRALRSLGPATVAVTVALIIGAAGFADAATGGTFLLGRTNTDNATSILRDTTGIPLALSAPSGKSPLSVTSSTQVNRLNAQYVGGDSVAQLQSTGGVGVTAAGADIALTDGYAPVVSTGKLPAGTYYVSATAQLYTAETGVAYCEVSTPQVTSYGGGGNADYYAQAAETIVATVSAGTVLSERCEGLGTGQSVYDAAITAIRISSNSEGTQPTARRIHIVPYLRKHHPVIGPQQG